MASPRQRRQRRLVALVLALMLVVPLLIALATVTRRDSAGADKPSAEQARSAARCRQAPGYVIAAVQKYVDRFAGVTGFEDRKLPAPPTAIALRDQFGEVRSDLATAGCDLDRFRNALADGLDRLRSEGPLAVAVAGLLRGAALTTLGGTTAPQHQRVAPGDDLAAAVASAPPGGSVRLGAGRYRLSAPIYVLQDVTLVGAGRGRTTVETTSAGAGVVVPRPVTLGLRALSLVHRGSQPGSLLVLWTGRAELDRVRLSGAVTASSAGTSARGAQAASGQGSGVLLAQDARVRLRRTLLTGNAVAGLIAGDRARVDVRSSSFTDNGLCGACFSGRAAGTVGSSVLSGNPIGAYVAERSHPTLQANQVRDNDDAGIAVQEQAHPVLRANDVAGGAGIGIAVYAGARPRIEGNTVHDAAKAGLVLDGRGPGRARVTDNRFHDNASGDIVVAGAGRHRLSGNDCESSYQLVLVAGASPRLEANACSTHRVSGLTR